MHVQHSWDEPDAAYLKPGAAGIVLMVALAAAAFGAEG